MLTLPRQARRWGSVGFSRGSTGLESIYPDFPDRRNGIPASSESPTACLLVHRGRHMTAAIIILACLSTDVPSFLCHGHELQTILRECTQVHYHCSQAEPLMRLAGTLPWCGSRFMRMLHFKQSRLVTESAVHEGVCECERGLFVHDLPGLLMNLVTEHQTSFCVCVYVCDCECVSN